MALTDDQLLALAGTLVVILVLMIYNQLKAKRGTAMAAGGSDGDEPSVNPMLSRFAHHDGTVVGETVAVDGDRLIVKQAGVFKAVPLAAAELKGDEVRISGDIDWSAAEESGQAWLERNRTGTDDQVTSDLTKSEDVKAPALAAFQKRQDGELPGGKDASDDSEE